MTERQQALKRLNDIRVTIQALTNEAQAIRAQYAPFTAEEHAVESARLEREFRAMEYFYTLDGHSSWDMEAHIAGFTNRESSRAFWAKYPEFEVRTIMA